MLPATILATEEQWICPGLLRPGHDPGTLAVRVPLTRALALEVDHPDSELAEAERLGWLAVRRG